MPKKLDIPNSARLLSPCRQLVATSSRGFQLETGTVRTTLRGSNQAALLDHVSLDPRYLYVN